MAAGNESQSGPELWFPETSWGRIQPGPAAPTAAETAALDALARTYHRPIYGWLRAALGKNEHDANDLAQDFFAWMLETGFVKKADPARGRFRAFLKTALRNYAKDADRRLRAEKRGGGKVTMPIDGDPDASWSPGLPDVGERAPDEALDEAWRAELVGRALTRTEEELVAEDKQLVFEVFKAYFLETEEEVDYATVAERHGVTKTDVSNYLMRAKRAYRTHLKTLVRDTVGSGADLAEELSWLLGGPS